MKTYLLKPGERQAIAKAGETGIAVAYNAKAWIDQYPTGVPQLMVTRPNGQRVPVTVTVTDNLIAGQVPDDLLVSPGVYSYVFVWTSGAAQLTSGRCECMVLGSDLAKTWADVKRAPDWAERIFLAAGVIETTLDGAMALRNETVDAMHAAEAAQGAAETAQGAAENAQEAAEVAQEAAEAAQAATEAVRDSIPEYTALALDVTNLKTAMWENNDRTEAPYRGMNLFNWRDSGNTTGQYRNNSGTLQTGQQSNYMTSHLILVKPGVSYTFGSVSNFGNSRGTVGLYNMAGEYIGYTNATYTGTGNILPATFTVQEYCYAQINMSGTYKQRVNFSETSQYSDVYVPYTESIRPGKYLDLTDSVKVEDLSFRSDVHSGNLFNKDGDVLEGYFFDQGNAGEIKTIADLSCQYVPFQGDGTYYLLYPKFKLGTSQKICAFGPTFKCVGVFPLTLDDSNDNAVAHFTATESNFTAYDGSLYSSIKYLGYVFASDLEDSVMIIKGMSYPGTYVPYDRKYSLNGITVQKGDTDFLTHTKSANLFNRWADIILGKRFNTSSSAATFEDDTQTACQFIPFEGPGTYWMYFPFLKYGSSSKVVLCDRDKNKLRMLSVTKEDTSLGNVNQPGYITVSDADAIDVAYLGFTLYANGEDFEHAMFVKADAYPEQYVPYMNTWEHAGVNTLRSVPNTLYRKKVLFDGDSICQYSTDRSNKGAYARRIADNNEMLEYNYGVGGGTITAGLYMSNDTPRHWVSRSIDTLYADHPDADYIILEGGTNDADVIGDITGGTTPAGFGTVSGETDFSGEYDDETFCGAVESLLYKATNYWPKAKIGFVIAMKMGNGTNTAGITKFLNRRAYFGKIMEICRKWGVPYINLWDECHMNPRMLPYYDSSKTVDENVAAGKFYIDGQHPAPAGYDYIAPIIEAWMRTI